MYTLVRLSATASNNDWFETTLPEDCPVPQWAEDIAQRVSRRVARSTALRDQESDSDSEGDEGDGTDNDAIAVDERERLVYPHTYRFWGLASSPGDGTTVVSVSRHKTQHADRNGLSKLQFGWYVAEDDAAAQPRIPMPATMSTESKLWEWMYGNGEGVAGTGTLDDAVDQSEVNQLKAHFKDALEHLECTFCDEKLAIKNIDAVCPNGHAFSKPFLFWSCSTITLLTLSQFFAFLLDCPSWLRGYLASAPYANPAVLLSRNWSESPRSISNPRHAWTCLVNSAVVVMANL